NQPKTYHRYHVANPDICRAHRVQRDAAKGGETALFERDCIRKFYYKILPGDYRLGVAGALSAVSNTIADSYFGDRLMFVDDYAGTGITEHRVLAQLGSNLCNSA